MKKIFYLSTLFFLTSCFIGASQNSKITANKPQHFPFVSGIDLNGKKYELPNDFAGKINIIALGFEREHQDPINTWIPSIDQLIKNTNPQIGLKFYEVPLIYELSTFQRGWVNNGMRFGIRDETARQRTITVYTDREEFFKIMDMKGDRIYLLLVDNNGKILFQCEGEMTKENLDKIVKIIAKQAQ